MDPEKLKTYLADSPPTVVRLEIKPHFDALTPQQRRYAHHISRAAFFGSRITLRQVSPESPFIYDFIIGLHRQFKGDWKALQKLAKISDEDLRLFLEYAAMFLGNLGNYKAIGDAKFIPRVPASVIKALVEVSGKDVLAAYEGMAGKLWETETPGKMHLGYIDQGHLSAYYLTDIPPISKEEITLIGDFLEKKNLAIYNTRLRKRKEGPFELLIASADLDPPAESRDVGAVTEWELEGKLAGQKLRLVYGDHSADLALIAKEIHAAKENAADETQRKMHEAYERSYTTGSLEAYKESQRQWIRDKGPVVEACLGFVEMYRDPHGVRAEWEGFVAMVNKERTKAFGRLVDGAEAMVPKLPWSKDFEKDHFLSPDFTSLEVLSFSGSMIPAGINIPNLDDVRQTEGFKNVSLGNVLSAKAPDEKIPFIIDKDQGLFAKYRDGAFEVQVGIHELLGHGTGKLLQETSPGVFNFDRDNPPLNPVTNEKVKTWYGPGQTWGSVFGSIAASYEECRAECVAMALSCDFEILKVFGFGDGTADIDGEAGDVLYVAYLQMTRAGLASLEMYDPEAKKWGQAHSQARFSILRCFLEAGSDFVELQSKERDYSDLHIHLDRSKILSVGRPAVERYLQQLHVYKSTADFEAGKRLYERMTSVDDTWAGPIRKAVLQKKKPGKIFVQANTVLKEDGSVELIEYEATLEGMIRSVAERGV